jgi:glycine hydroxymethyltransferase|nr:MAG TPA: serine hydroxymethyltransferase [Caudoviricetes sp.]
MRSEFMYTPLDEIYDKELRRQTSTVELIASENFVSPRVLKYLGSEFTNKYTEGYPGKRYYGGCEFYDELECYCQELWKDVFSTTYHVNVQPHSGTSANLAAISAVVNPGETILSMSLDCGGHLSHGARVSQVGKLYNIINYGVDDNGWIDYNEVAKLADQWQPKLIICGASAYSRKIDYIRFAEIARSVNAYLLADIAHVAGLIAANKLPSPFGYADIITSTTQKTLRGPRGGLIFCIPELAKKIDSAVFPGTQGGSLMNVIAAKAACAEEVLEPEFIDYIDEIMYNAKAMAERFMSHGYNVITGGTDNHMFLVDLRGTGLTGIDAQNELERNDITLNKNAIPNDPLPPSKTSGIRIGTPAMTTRGWKAHDFCWCADNICKILDEMRAAL